MRLERLRVLSPAPEFVLARERVPKSPFPRREGATPSRPALRSVCFASKRSCRDESRGISICAYQSPQLRPFPAFPRPGGRCWGRRGAAFTSHVEGVSHREREHHSICCYLCQPSSQYVSPKVKRGRNCGNPCARAHGSAAHSHANPVFRRCDLSHNARHPDAFPGATH